MQGVLKVHRKRSSHTGDNFEFAEILLAMIDKPGRNLATIAHGRMMPASRNRQQCKRQQTASKLAMQDTKETSMLGKLDCNRQAQTKTTD